MQLGVFRHPRLNKEPRRAWIDADREPVDDHVPDALLDDRGPLVLGGQGVPVGHEKEALVFLLQGQPVFEDAMIMAEMQPARGTHARQHPLLNS